MDIVSFNGFRDPTKYTTKNKKFEDSLYDYLLIATKLVQKLCTKDVCVEILYDEDALSNMAHSLMMADWRWDGKYISKNKRTKTQYSYRSQCIIYEIKKHLRRKRRVYSQKFKQSLNYTSVDETQPLYCKIVDRSSLGVNPIEIAIQKYEKIKEAAKPLVLFPNQGRVIPELLKHNITKFKELIISPWRLMYKIENNVVYVMAVIDGRRNIEDILLQRLLR